MADKIRIGIVDVYPIFRDGVAQAIARANDLTVIAAGGTADDARRLAWRCDVLLLEPAVPASLDLAKEILESTNTKVVFLSARLDDEHAFQAGQGFAEVTHTWHNGRNLGDKPARFLIVFSGQKGIPNLIRP